MHNITTNMMYNKKIKKKSKKKSATGEGIVGRGDFGMFVGQKKKNRPDTYGIENAGPSHTPLRANDTAPLS
jgi:hypothetical protein